MLQSNKPAQTHSIRQAVLPVPAQPRGNAPASGAQKKKAGRPGLRLNKGSVFYNASLLTMSGLTLQIIGFIYRIYLSRVAGAEGLGLYRLIMPVHSLSIALAISGVRMATTALSAEMTMPRDKLAVRLLARVCILCFLAVFFLMALPVMVFQQDIAAHVLGDIRTMPSLPVIMACIFLTGFELVLESVFLGINKTKYTAVSNLLEQVVQMAVVIFLLVQFGGEDPGRSALLICIGMAFSEVPVVIWLVVSYKRVVLRLPSPQNAPKPEIKPLLGRITRIALPVMLGGTIQTLIASAGTVLLPQRLMAAGLSESEAVGQLGIITGMAVPLMSFPMLFLTALSTVMLPTVSHSLALGRQNDLRRKIRKAIQAVSLIALPATAVLLPLASDLAMLLYNQPLSDHYLFLLAVAVVLQDYQLVSLSILNGLGQQRRAMCNVILGELVELGLMFTLTALPQVRIYGYIIGMIVCGSLIVLLNLRLIVKKTGVRFSLAKQFLLPLLVAVIAGLFSNAIYTVLRPQMSAVGAVLTTLAGAVGVYILLILMIGIRPVRYFKGILQRGDGAEQQEYLRRTAKGDAPL